MPLIAKSIRAAISAANKPKPAVITNDNRHDGKPRNVTDGGGLVLYVRPGSLAHWVFYTRDANGKRIAKSLGAATAEPAPGKLTVAEARYERDAFKVALKNGAVAAPKPRGSAAAEPTGETFADAVRTYLNDHKTRWPPAEYVRRERLLDKYCAPIAAKRWRTLSVGSVADVVRPIWKGPNVKPGSLLRSLIEHVLQHAENVRRKAEDDAAEKAGLEAQQWPAFNNVARWKGCLDGSAYKLAADKVKAKNHNALPVADLPAFFATAPDVLQFITLTAARRGEVTGDENGKSPMTWQEINLQARTWTIPGSRMKNGEEHTVPLSDLAIAILQRQPTRHGQVFDGSAKHWAHKLGKLAQRAGVTVHGFRSTFADWAREQGPDRDHTLVDMCLAHAVGTAAAQSYQRSTLLARRRVIMQAWADFCRSSDPILAPETVRCFS
jgi:integrase